MLYLHVPFCEELCGFCSFNRNRFEEGIARRYFGALRTEIAIYHSMGCKVVSLYVGGGTPTVLPGELVQTIGLVRSLWNPSVISVETHPDHLTEETCARMEEAGVNRLSVGVQSFQEPVLRALDRRNQHIGPEEIRARIGRSIQRFRTVNVDLIYGVPGQTIDSLKKDILVINGLLPHQVTFYPLMGPSPPHGPSGVPPRRSYALIRGELSDRYRPSSGWSFSLAEGGAIDEYITDSEDYAGLGAGSFGYLDGRFYANTFSITSYLRDIDARKLPIIISRPLRRGERIRYYSLMSLFNGHFDLRDVVRRFGFFPLLPLWRELVMVAAAGGIGTAAATISLTGKGRYFSMLMMRAFFSAVAEFRELCRQISAD
jgi:coproporphyrinogen III oxidase-like Fe-S oxidoreductase